MLYSHKSEDENFLLFTLFINNILNGKKEYSSQVKLVIKEAKALIDGDEDYYTISKDNYPITVFLSKNAKQYLSRINPESLTNTDYQQLLEIVEGQSSVLC